MIEFLIVGSGFTAATLCYHLLEAGIQPNVINIVGPTKLGYGNAFNCMNDNYRLNVRSEIMWIDPNNKLEFTNWAKKNIIDEEAYHEAGNFYKRSDFGRFVHSKINKLIEKGQLFHKKEIVKKIYKDKSGNWTSFLGDNTKIDSKNIILATGNPTPKWPFALNKAGITKNKNLVENPWNGNWIKSIHKNDNILLIGSGLTSLDCIASLKSIDHKGEIHVVSPSGKFPPANSKWERQKIPIWPYDKNNRILPSNFLNFIKNYLPSKPVESSEWQSAWEELRQNINDNWKKLPDKGKLSFKKKLNSTWSRYRYRASPQSIIDLIEFQKNQKLFMHKGKVKNIIQNKNTIILTIGDRKSINVDKIINCSGKGEDKLAKQIIKSKIGFSDIFNETLEVDDKFRVLRIGGKPNKGLYMISPNLTSKFGDIVAANSLATQSIHLASMLSYS